MAGMREQRDPPAVEQGLWELEGGGSEVSLGRPSGLGDTGLPSRLKTQA